MTVHVQEVLDNLSITGDETHNEKTEEDTEESKRALIEKLEASETALSASQTALFASETALSASETALSAFDTALSTSVAELVSVTAKLQESDEELKLRADQQRPFNDREPLFQVGVAVRRYFFEQTRLNTQNDDAASPDPAASAIIMAGKRAILRGNYAADSALFHLGILSSPADLEHFKYIYTILPNTLVENQIIHSRLIQTIFDHKGTFRRYQMPEDPYFEVISGQILNVWVNEYKNKAPGIKAACEAFDKDAGVLANFEKMEEHTVFLLKRRRS